MKHVVTQAILLNRLNFSEADRIIKVITPGHGKVSLLARGVRKVNSKLAGGLELFSLANVTYIDGKSELKTITSSRLEKHFGQIVTDMQSTMLAYEFMKMIDQATEESCEESYFELLLHGLEALQDRSENLNTY